MKAAQKLAYVALIWLSIALIGYGIALRQAAHRERVARAATATTSGTAPAAAPGAPNEATLQRDGRISWSNVGNILDRDVKIKLNGADEMLIIPGSSIAASRRKPAEIMGYLHPGAQVHLIVRASDHRVLQLVSNFGTVYQKNLISEADVAQGDDVELASIESRGMLFAILGALLLPMLAAGHLFRRYQLQRS